MKETPSTNGVDLSGRFIPDGDRNAVALTFAEEVAHRAYFLYMDSSARHGHDVEHWLLAEQQIRGEGAPLKTGYSLERDP